MKRVVSLALRAAAVWSACARPSPEQQVVASDFKCLRDAAGGRARTAQLHTPTPSELQRTGARQPARSCRSTTLAPIHGDQTPYCLFVENTIAMTQLLSAPSRRRGAAGGRGTGSE
ncbi:MAG: hypothetical protein DMF92_08625 [Acidobacteria bacterium]|nr:MAG: hypothetical protein DMF92_08625 [Acidobacteriota bacterium]